MPLTNVPFAPPTTRLKLSKLPSAICDAVPPFGAFGFTYSKCLNPAEYFRFESFERPCRQASGSRACAAEISSAFLRAGGPPASTRRADLIKDRRSIGTPDTRLAQDGHYARAARILKTAGRTPPKVQHRRCLSSRKAPRDREPMGNYSLKNNKAPNKNPAPRRVQIIDGPQRGLSHVLSLGRPRDRCKRQGCNSPVRYPQPLPAPRRTLQKPECLLG